MKRLAMLLMVAVMSVPSMAGLYVDAKHGEGGNTYNALTDSLTDWAKGRANDGFWNARTGQGNNVDFLTGAMGGANTTVYSASDDWDPAKNILGEDAVALYTVASGLTAGQLYDVSVVFWSAKYSNTSFTIRAGFSLDSMILFDRDGKNGATKGVATTKPLDGDRNEYMGTIGKIAADGNGQIKVYIDDLPVNPGFDNTYRTYYDGVMITPEPATLMILGLGALMAARRR